MAPPKPALKQPTFDTKSNTITFFYPYPRSLQCPVEGCDKAYDTGKKALQRHIDSHTKVKPTQKTFCIYCSAEIPAHRTHRCIEISEAESDGAEDEESRSSQQF